MDKNPFIVSNPGQKSSTPDAPEPKPQKTAKKTALFAKLSVWIGLGGIAYCILVLLLFVLFRSLSLNFHRNLDVGIISFVPMILAAIPASLSAIIGFFQIYFSKGRLKGNGYCAIGIFVSLFVILIGTPNFLRFQARAKQSPAKFNLDAIYTAYQAYHSDYNTYPSSPSIQVGNTVYNCLSITGWKPKNSTRYNFNCMNIEVFSSSYVDFPCPSGTVTSASKDKFTFASCTNLDGDLTIDVWTIDEAKHLKNVIDDVKE